MGLKQKSSIRSNCVLIEEEECFDNSRDTLRAGQRFKVTVNKR